MNTQFRKKFLILALSLLAACSGASNYPFNAVSNTDGSSNKNTPITNTGWIVTEHMECGLIPKCIIMSQFQINNVGNYTGILDTTTYTSNSSDSSTNVSGNLTTDEINLISQDIGSLLATNPDSTAALTCLDNAFMDAGNSDINLTLSDQTSFNLYIANYYQNPTTNQLQANCYLGDQNTTDQLGKDLGTIINKYSAAAQSPGQ